MVAGPGEGFRSIATAHISAFIYILLFTLRSGDILAPMRRELLSSLSVAACVVASSLQTSAAPIRHILFFSKSSGFEHSAITWKNGRPSFAGKVLEELGKAHDWEFTFSKDGSKFSKDYLDQFDAVFFYTTGDLCTAGTDGQPPMSPQGKQALIDYVRAGHGLLGTHSASDTFHTSNSSGKELDRYENYGEKADPYIRLLGGEFIKHGAQQVATNTVVDPGFPGFKDVDHTFAFKEEWYSLKDFTPDIHVLTVIDAPAMTGEEYDRPPYPTTWARKEGTGRVWYTAMGHREDVWTNPTFQKILVGGIEWALGDAHADAPPNIHEAASGAYKNPPKPGR